MKILIGIIVVILLGVSGYFYFSKGSGVINPEVAKIRQAGALVIATDATYPPLEYVDDNSKIVGFDIDLANEIAKGLGVSAQIKNVSFDKIFDALKAGDVDVIISSVTITAERQKEMLFSTPYLNAGQILVVASDSSIAEVNDLKGKTVGVQADTTSQKEALKYTEKSLVKSYADYTLAERDLIAGKIQAIVVDYPAGVEMAKNSKGQLKVVGKPFTSEFYGVAVAKGRNGLLSAIDGVIASLKKTGRLSQLENLWFKR